MSNFGNTDLFHHRHYHSFPQNFSCISGKIHTTSTGKYIAHGRARQVVLGDGGIGLPIRPRLREPSLPPGIVHSDPDEPIVPRPRRFVFSRTPKKMGDPLDYAYDAHEPEGWGAGRMGTVD